MHLAVLAVLPPYSSGPTNSIELDFGDSVIHTVPVRESCALPEANPHLKLAGRDPTHRLMEAHIKFSYSLTMTVEREIVRQVKKLGYVALDFGREAGTASANPFLEKGCELPYGQAFATGKKYSSCLGAFYNLAPLVWSQQISTKPPTTQPRKATWI
ncbi:Actin alpha skeletal muscle [Fasciola hepatica]|uniref:Actin alpha skeletal muscle n=1 Tax=Fasciola hepatica TaxID=6192 RepID=A0A4E0R814_FASHE|nr:Actin alpha skeletal muscle [Fasciola hepatica]